MLECNFADHKIASLCTLFTEANNKLTKVVLEHDDLEQHASCYKRECDDNDWKVKKLERRLDDSRESEIADQHSRICTYQKQIDFWNHKLFIQKWSAPSCRGNVMTMSRRSRNLKEDEMTGKLKLWISEV